MHADLGLLLALRNRLAQEQGLKISTYGHGRHSWIFISSNHRSVEASVGDGTFHMECFDVAGPDDDAYNNPAQKIAADSITYRMSIRPFVARLSRLI
jgi:hypothetical protein